MGVQRLGVLLLVALVACSSSGTSEAPHPPIASGTASSVESSVAAPSASGHVATSAARTRAAFAAALASVRIGESADDVLAALGPPDDIKTAKDPGGISATRTTEVWRYGTDAHLSLGTLGTVHIQADRTVQYVFGGKGAPPPDGMFAEDDLRRILRCIDAVPSYDAPANPLLLIRAVNALQKLGKEKAIAALTEYLRVSSSFDDGGREGTFLVLRALFDVPDKPGFLPTMQVGAPSPPGPPDPHAVPRYPVIIVDDIPFVLVRGYELGGQPEPPESHLEWFRANGVLRRAPLVPTTTPLATLDRIVGSKSTAFLSQTGVGEDGRMLIAEQGARLLVSALGGALPTKTNADDELGELHKAAKGHKLVWDKTTDGYTSND